ncbi:MAG: Wzz/FepE/Etk N-terminal domain-containing protein [Anaerolineae bacterium]
MKDRSDIRRYGEAVWRHGWWIAVLALMAAALATLLGALTPATYTSSALVGIIDRSNVVAFDPRFLPLERDLPSFEPYPALATSEAVLQDLLARLGDDAPEDGSIEALRERLSAALAADKVLLRLSASADSPDEALQLADAWAKVVVAHASQLYETMDIALLAWYEEQLADARADLTTARDELVRHDVAAAEQGLGAELMALEAEIDRLAAELSALRSIERDAQAARQAASEPGHDSQVLAAGVAMLQQRVLQPLAEVQPAADALTEDPLAALDRVEATASERMQDVEALLADASVRQRQLQGAAVAQDAGRREVTWAVREAEERVLLLAGELERARLAAEDSRIKVQLTSPASRPSQPTKGGVQPLVVGAAALSGLLLGSVLAILLAERRTPRDTVSAER